MGKKRIYIAGAGGMLGEAFYEVFKGEYELRCTDIDVNADWLSFLDFRGFEDYKADVLDFKPHYLFHLGALTNLEYCELHSDEAYITNTTAVEHAIRISNEQNIPLLYISTAGIFDGKKKQYTDNDMPNPVGHYANSKYLAEKAVRENKIEHLICRAGWMMGGGPGKDKKFIQLLMKQLKEGKKELFIVNDKLGTPTYTYDFAENVKLLLEKKSWGVYNIVCGGETDRMAIARELLELLGMQYNVKLTPVSSLHFKEQYFAPRPGSERLINQNLERLGLNIMREWQVCLKEYLAKHYAGYL